MTGTMAELLHATRSLLRSPGFAAVAILTMGLGIGANSAIFGVVYGVLLAPIPYEEADRIVQVHNRYLPSGGTGWVSGAELAEYAEVDGPITQVLPITPDNMNLTGLPTPLRLEGMRVGPGFFNLLGVDLLMGREFAADEGRPGRPPVVILSHGLWQTAFGGDPAILGRSVELDGSPRTVVGIAPADYRPLSDYLFTGREESFWTPLVVDPATFDARSVEVHDLLPIARLAAGLDVAEAERRMLPAVERLEATYPDISNAGSREVALVPLRNEALGGAGGTLLLLSVAVGLVLLVACVNVANLLLARSDVRASEAAVRAAMGADRSRLVWYGMAEAIVIGLAGGVLGILVTALGRGALLTLVPSTVAIPGGISMGLPVVGFTVVLSLLAGLLAGAFPALRMASGDVFASIKAGGAPHGPPRSRRALLRRAMVVGQVAGAVVLVVSASLLVRSLVALRYIDPGFEAADRHLVPINATRSGYPDGAAVERLYTQLVTQIEALDGVEMAAVSWQTPQQGQVSDWPVFPETDDDPDWHAADPNFVSPGYFETYGIEVVEGRGFEREDAERDIGPIVLSRTAAERLWGSESAVGRRVNLSFGEPVWREVIGVVEDVRGRGLAEEPRIQTYMTFGEGPFSSIASLVLTTRGRLAGAPLARAVQEVLGGIDSDVPVGVARSLEAQVAATIERERLLSVLFTAFGALALTLGAIGVYGMISFSVRRRTREIGLRIAIGAQPGAVLSTVVRQGLLLGAVGVAVGIAGALAAGRLLESFLFEVSETDPVVLALVSVGVLAVAAVASFVPALRAAAVDPLTALRD